MQLLKPCRRCGQQPTLRPVMVAYQPAMRYECQCGRHGASRKDQDAAEDAWNDLQCFPVGTG